MKVIHLYTTYKQYKDFYEKYNTQRLYKGLKIFSGESSKRNLFFNPINEIFDSELETNYKIFKNKNNDLKIKFKTNSNTLYRLDLFLKEEKGKELSYHIAFSLCDSKINNYNDLTDKNEMIEILNRIKFIINDLKNENILKINYFCIGATELLSKNSIYEYFLKIVLSDNSFDKLQTKLYNEGWGLYFKI